VKPEVKIEGFAFLPPSLEVAAGAAVVWTNQDPAPHTVTAGDGSFDSGILATGATFPRTFPTAGTVLYRCNLHPAMQGQIVVK
jgi:plastocyanin